MIRYSEQLGLLESQTLGDVFALYHSIFHDDGAERYFYGRIATNPFLYTVVAFDKKAVVGFKIGYFDGDDVFYSWLSAVKPSHRGQGIGAELMDKQYSWAQRQGVKTIRTKTRNQWKEMMVLNLKHDFNIVETYVPEDGELRIVMEREVEPLPVAVEVEAEA